MKRIGCLGLVFASSLTQAAVTLDDAYRAALSRNESVQDAQESVVQADETVNQLIAGVLPDISANLNHLTTQTPPPAFASFSPQHQTTISVGLNQPIFRGLREFAGLRQAKHVRSSAEWMKQQYVDTVYLECVTAYLNVLALEKDTSNLAEQLELYEKRAMELQGQTTRGESNESDLVSLQAAQAALEADRHLAEAKLEGARNAFQSLTGLARESELVDPAIGKGKNVALETFLKRIEHRPDIKAAVEAHRAAQEAVSVAWGGHWPTIDLTANYYFLRPGFLNDFKWDIGGRITFPLFQGGKVSSGVRDAISKRSQMELRLHKLRRLAERDVRSHYETWEARKEHLKMLKASLELSQKNSKLKQRDLRRGLVRAIDVQMALSDLTTARRGFDLSRFQAQTDYVNLQAVAGMLPTSKGNP